MIELFWSTMVQAFSKSEQNWILGERLKRLIFVILAHLSECGERKCGHEIKQPGGHFSLMGYYNVSKGHLNLRVASSEDFLLSTKVLKKINLTGIQQSPPTLFYII